MDPHAWIKYRIYGLGVVFLLVLVILHAIGLDRQLLKVLAVVAALLVGLLLITYRAFAGVANAARNNQLGPVPPPDDEDDQ